MADDKDPSGDEQPPRPGDRRTAADHARQLNIQALQTELAVLELRARHLGLGEVAHFAGVAAVAASELIKPRRRRPGDS